MKKKGGIFLILHDIRSVHNVGSIFRTADAAGVSKIFLTGYTPSPIDRFRRKRKDFTKVSLGAEKSVSWEVRSEALSLMRELRKEGVTIVSVEQSPYARDYRRVARIKAPVVLVYGNEVNGLSQEILDASDNIVEIPMRGHKESLNVSVSVGISLFRFLENVE